MTKWTLICDIEADTLEDAIDTAAHLPDNFRPAGWGQPLNGTLLLRYELFNHPLEGERQQSVEVTYG